MPTDLAVHKSSMPTSLSNSVMSSDKKQAIVTMIVGPHQFGVSVLDTYEIFVPGHIFHVPVPNQPST
ncbi:MAG: hypothetical protein ACKVG9_06260 [Rhodospirillales bacterium]|jgi:hypothetical protein